MGVPGLEATSMVPKRVPAVSMGVGMRSGMIKPGHWTTLGGLRGSGGGSESSWERAFSTCVVPRSTTAA